MISVKTYLTLADERTRVVRIAVVGFIGWPVDNTSNAIRSSCKGQSWMNKTPYRVVNSYEIDQNKFTSLSQLQWFGNIEVLLVNSTMTPLFLLKPRWYGYWYVFVSTYYYHIRCDSEMWYLHKYHTWKRTDFFRYCAAANIFSGKNLDSLTMCYEIYMVIIL